MVAMIPRKGITNHFHLFLLEVFVSSFFLRYAAMVSDETLDYIMTGLEHKPGDGKSKRGELSYEMGGRGGDNM